MVQNKSSFLYSRARRVVDDLDKLILFKNITWKRPDRFVRPAGNSHNFSSGLTPLLLEQQSVVEMQIAKWSDCFIPAVNYDTSFSYMVLRQRQLDRIESSRRTVEKQDRSLPYNDWSSWGVRV